MKISKVSHTKAAVGINSENNEMLGILYQDPGKEIPFDERFKTLNKNAKNLYNIFNQVLLPVQKKNQKDEEYQEELKLARIHKKYIDSLNTSLSGLIFYKTEENVKEIRQFKDIITRLKNVDRVDEDDLDKYMSLYLRKSLQKKKEELKVLIHHFGGQKGDISEKDRAGMKEFTDFLCEDFHKSKQAENIRKSIENQNMLFQPAYKDGKTCIALSQSKGKERKVKEKEGFSTFFRAYSSLKEEIRLDLLRRLRRLIDFYFYRERKEEADFDVWDCHAQARENKAYFVDLPDYLIHKKKCDTDKEKKEAKEEYKKAILQAKEDARRQNIQNYRAAMEEVSKDNGSLYFSEDGMNEFWIHHIENVVVKIYQKADPYKIYRFEKGYISEKVWKDCLNYISIKYVALGKAVYHFSMEELLSDKDTIDMGIVSQQIEDGISSFDYEMIKADETLQREVSLAIAYAANNLARATVDMEEAATNSDGMEDFLLWKEEDIQKYRKNSEDGATLKAILQFFGGASHWDTDIFAGKETELLSSLQQMIYSLRNENFHFRTENTWSQQWDHELIAEIFRKDMETCVGIEKTRFYSNNLPEFYAEKDLKKILNKLYSSYVPRASQVPSFHSVYLRKDFVGVINDLYGIKVDYSSKDKERWLSALYYLFKEIYYNGFLATNSSSYFRKALYDIEKQASAKEKYAVSDFKKRCMELIRLGKSLSEICQYIMTEYNAQNSKERKVKSTYSSKRHPEIFQHYKILLQKTLVLALKKYIEEQDLYKCIFQPRTSPGKMEYENFLPGWKSKIYHRLSSELENNPELQRWYVTGRFLNGRSLSLLVGSLRSYIQYKEDVARRADQTGNKLFESETLRKDKIYRIHKIAEIIDLCIKLNAVYSNNYSDYFNSDEEYADYLSHFLAFKEDSLSTSSFAQLDTFCNGEKKLDIYMDGRNPIMNRNIIMSKLFAPTKLMEAIIDKAGAKVTKEEVVRYYESQDEISKYKVKGICEDAEEQKKLLAFQRLKNHVEFRDLVEYAELLNDLQGQLINWSYLRERDLLYFQLGFHYSCLQDPGLQLAGYRQITGKDNKTIYNAILYQIMALYINGISIYSGKKKACFDKKSPMMLTGGRIGAFLSYTQQLIKDSAEYNDRSKDFIFFAGLEVFENVKEHDDITDLRNYIDHFKYYSANNDRSMLDLYGEVFDRFFTYDMKYQKSVITQLENILMRHFVILNVHMGTGEKMIDRRSRKECARIDIRKRGLSSDRFTYKYKDGELKIDAKSPEYLNMIAALLYFPADCPDEVCTEESRVKEINLKEEAEEPSHGNNSARSKNKEKSSGNKKNKNKRKNESVNHNNSGMYTMGDLLKNIRLD